MNVLIFKSGELEIWKRGERYYVRYDVGSITTIMREDEISEAEALTAAKGINVAMDLLWVLRRRLTAQGIDTYKSNLYT